MSETNVVEEAAGPITTFAEDHANAIDGIASLFGILFAYLPIPAVEKDVALGVLNDIKNFADRAKAEVAAPGSTGPVALEPDTRFLSGASETAQQQQTETGV